MNNLEKVQQQTKMRKCHLIQGQCHWRNIIRQLQNPAAADEEVYEEAEETAEKGPEANTQSQAGEWRGKCIG